MQKRYVYVLQDEEKNIIATETGLKKLLEKHSENRAFLSYSHLRKLVGKKKDAEGTVTFNGKDGNTYHITPQRIQ